jgi:Uncharacterized conserved protein
MTDLFVELPGARAVMMGSDDFYPEEAPRHTVDVAPFALERFAVTNERFGRFVDATGYVTVAERPVTLPGAPQPLPPGSMVFTPTAGPVDLRDISQWWRWVPGANWRNPSGPGSSLAGREDHPVVHIAYADAVAFAAWSGARLPTEAEWEYAARGGLADAAYAWGDDDDPRMRANTWRGRFPYENTGSGVRGWQGTAPVGSFPPNDFGLFEMTGNVWEWTSTVWSADHAGAGCGCGCGTAAVADMPMRTLKGGSHLCSPSYCLRYRPAARSPQTEDSATTHVGFRLARDLPVGSDVRAGQ